ncbi:MAG: SLC26A/SulP transporter family protein, partial [Rectinemataceae bacterium]
FFYPELRSLEHNKAVIGVIQASVSDLASSLEGHWRGLLSLKPATLATVLVPAATLAVLLSIDTLKTCVVLGVMTGQRNDSNRELVAQGIGNGVSALFGGMPGAGTMGATLVNLSSGGRTRLSGILEGAFGVAILLLLAQFIAWIPISALAGILLVVGFRMIDVKSLDLVKHKSTRLDFAVIVAVVVAALSYSLLVASGVGIAMAIILFLREQVGFPVIRHKRDGSKVFSKKRRTEEERAVLEAHGGSTTVCELQGQLFFGTADQLYTQLEGSFASSRRLIIDLKRVRSIDFTAVNMLKQIHRKVHEHGGILCLSSINSGLAGGITMLEYMNELGFAQENESLKITRSLEEAIQWSEDSLLAEHQVVRDPRPFEIAQFSLFRGIPEEVMAIIAGSIELRELPAGQKVFSQGEMSDEIFFIRSGAVKISLALQGGGSHELATFQKGDFFGEMAFLDKDRRSADAIADGDASIYAFSHARFREIARGHPDAGTIVFSRLAKEISHRLRLNNIELKGLEES